MIVVYAPDHCATPLTMLLPITVLYRMSRTRLMSGMVAFSKSAAEMGTWRAQLRAEIAYFREEYATLLYGGRMLLQVRQ